jgi:hypothetical protein
MSAGFAFIGIFGVAITILALLASYGLDRIERNEKSRSS